MKFKSQDKQNQRIDNISSFHLVVGVDIAQENHVARRPLLVQPCSLAFIKRN